MYFQNDILSPIFSKNDGLRFLRHRIRDTGIANRDDWFINNGFLYRKSPIVVLLFYVHGTNLRSCRDGWEISE